MYILGLLRKEGKFTGSGTTSLIVFTDKYLVLHSTWGVFSVASLRKLPQERSDFFSKYLTAVFNQKLYKKRNLCRMERIRVLLSTEPIYYVTLHIYILILTTK